jgi:signal recognition particle receptor subunit beta
MDGAILLVDVTVPVDDLTRDLAQSLNAAQVPYVVFLNKCDGAGADPDAFAGLSGSAEIRRISARDPVQCRDALLEFAGTLNPRAISRTG